MNISNNNNVNAEYQTDELSKSSQFRCVVSNEAGEVTSAAMILVLGKHIAWSITSQLAILCSYISVETS